jgi:hypothetical protein
MEFDTAGAGAPGALIGAAIERPTGHGGEAHNVCADCGAELVGRFCHQCGQPAHIHRTLLHLGEELLHGVMHFDGRIWRTLPLLAFRPGRLTREWVHGRRSRYVSPLAMFLFAIFLMFMLLSMLPKSPEKTLGEVTTEKAAEVVSDATRVNRLEEKLKLATPEDRPEVETDLAKARAELVKTKDELAGLQKAAEMGVPDGDWRAQVAKRAESGQMNINIGSDKLNKKIEEKFANPELAIYKLQQTFYKFSFLLVPLSIPFVAALFLWKRGFTLYDHGVFVLYSLTFMSVLITIAAIAFRFDTLSSLVFFGMMIVVPAHMYFQLKGAYSLSRFSALWRTFFLLIFCFITIVLFFLAIIWLGFG